MGMPSLLGRSGTQPTRPDVRPVRSDFENKPEMGGWKKVLGLGLATLAGSPQVTEQVLHGQRDKADRQYQQASRDWQGEQADKEQQARLEEMQARTNALRNPKPVEAKPELETWNDLMKQGIPPREAYEILKSAGKAEPQAKPDSATQEDQRYEKIKTNATMRKPVTPEDAAWAQAYEKRKTLGPALTSGAAATRQDKSFTQQEKMLKLREQALSAPTKSMIEAAPTVEGLAGRIDPLIDKLDSELGPGSGRWTEFWTGKVGSKNPEYTKLRTDVSLLQTALMRMHVGAKGGDQMMAHFKDIIDQGKQDPDNMRAALSEIRQYVNDLKAKGIAGGMSSGVLNSESGGRSGQGQITVTDPNGGQHTFPDQASADRFKKLAKIQ